MKISTNTLTFITNKYNSSTDLIPESVGVLSQKIGSQLGEIETIDAYGKKFEGVVVVRVMTCIQHPNADRLHVCSVDDGGITSGVDRDESGYVQIVCGAPNVHEGMLAAWLPPGCTVPDSVETDPFVLDARELRGVTSNGMLASPKELTISDAHEGILEIVDDITPGTLFADAYDLRNDYVLDIENKMFTHRPDCFGWLGVAREIAGIQNKQFVSPGWYVEGIPGVFEVKSDKTLPLQIKNELPELVPRFVAVTLSDVVIKPSPLWLQLRLARHGIRPINNVVDITNFMMLETGQPMHAYDYDKVRALDENADSATIAVRAPKDNEKLDLLSGKTITPHKNAILITSDSTAIGLGGVMGGADTEVSDATKNIILECATFDMYSIRRTAMTHGIFTDAVTRYTKGQSPLQNKQVVEKAMEMLEKYADAKYCALHDDNHIVELNHDISITAQFINDRLGLDLALDKIRELLANVEFVVAQDNDDLIVRAPFWRTDIAIAEDIVEEVGRLYGFDKLPLDLPFRSIAPTPKDASLDLKTQVRELLSRAGANEVLTYSFVHGNILTRVDQNTEDAFSLSNALSPDLQYYRLSITPSLLEKVHPNSKTGHSEFALFEIGKSHAVSQLDEEGLPLEFTNIALVYAADEKIAKSKSGAAFYQARLYATELLDALGAEYSVEPAGEAKNVQEAHTIAPFDPRRLAAVRINNQVVGYIGEFSFKTQKNMKLPLYSAGFELNFDALLTAQRKTTSYTALSRFPKVEQDITLKVKDTVSFTQLYTVLQKSLHSNVPEYSIGEITAKDIYRPENSDMVHYTFRITVASYVNTLTDKTVNSVLDNIAASAHDVFDADRI